MSGSVQGGQPNRRSPMLLALVYGIFLVLVGVTASALVVVTTTHLSSSTLSATVARDRTLVELFVNGSLTTSDLDDNGPGADRAQEVEARLATVVAADEILRLEIRSTAGRVLLASSPGLRGEAPTPSTAMRAAMAGTPWAGLVTEDELSDPAGDPLGAAEVVQQYLPILAEDGRTLAVVAIWRDAAPLLAGIAAAQRDTVVVTLAAGAVLAVILFFVFRAAQRRITRQHAQLIEAERRDPLTGLLNHGAIVSMLAQAVEEARREGGRIGLGLVDVDNFGLFNDAHGHDAADEVLLRVAALVEREEPGRAKLARYGPDEFLLFVADGGVAEVESVIARVRQGLAEETIQFGESERLPISVSAGICAFPEHATAVTDLLSALGVALAEAKAGGGDATRVAHSADEARAASASFDVLQGLVIAVDTKDRYTKRHSEDVARYAVFLARLMGMDEELCRTIHLAGLLHDVGKIGIPDALLRKPSRLTAAEFDVFKQHVALGDAIVRDVPQAETVRAGIRHHHERWDGGGYLDGLEGETIPVIARVLAVADAFSAMTTTRPYRKALPVTEAIKRLGDAAGTQLQEELVTAFIAGIETATDAPLPGDAAAGIWRPELWVA
ncbi:MAG: bifunctional diguanylate cyclase/phosphohydrolase [Candidatus Limnocylindria bacterium]